MNQSSKQPQDAKSKDAAAKMGPTGKPLDGDRQTDADGPDSDALPQFITKLAPLEEQVGMHVIAALQHPKTFAVLTTVASDGAGSQQIVSIALDANRFEQIQRLLTTAKTEGKRRVRCVGFHCHFEDDEAADEAGEMRDEG